MPCRYPTLAFYHKSVKQRIRMTTTPYHRTPSGEDFYSTEKFKQSQNDKDWIPFPKPCEKCKFCRLQNSREKAIRATNEASLYEDNCFITLTYNPEHLPKHGSYEIADVQKFMKDLRNWNCINQKCKGHRMNWKTFKEVYTCRGFCSKIRSFGCAEYGDKLSRPHFHLCLFNFDFQDKWHYRDATNDWSDKTWPVYRSKTLEKIWQRGFSDCGTLTFQSAAYVARYVTKKINGKLKDDHYGDKLPERAVCVSNRKGIGLPWLEKFAQDCLNNDSVIYKGRQLALPRYYNKKLETLFPVEFALVKEKRKSKIRKIDLDSTKERLETRSRIYERSIKRLKRSYENGT